MSEYIFPSNPSNGDTVTVSGITYTWNASPGYWTNNVVGEQLLSVGADTGTDDTINVGVDTLNFEGGTGVTTTVTNNNIKIDASPAPVAFSVGADTGTDDSITPGTDTLNFEGGTGVTTTVTNNNIKIDASPAPVAFSVGADTGTDDNVTPGTDTLNFEGGTGVTTTVSNNNIRIDASPAPVAFSVGANLGTDDSITPGTDTLNFQGGTGVSTTVSNNNIRIDLASDFLSNNSSSLTATSIASGTAYVIKTLGNTNWSSLGATAITVSSVSSLSEGTEYIIKSLGSTTTQTWTSMGADTNPAVGEIFVGASVDLGSGSGEVYETAFTATSNGSGTGTAMKNANHFITFMDSANGSNTLLSSSSLTYNPGTGYLQAGNLQGSFFGEFAGTVKGTFIGGLGADVAAAKLDVTARDGSVETDDMYFIMGDGSSGVRTVEAMANIKYTHSTTNVEVPGLTDGTAVLKSGTLTGNLTGNSAGTHTGAVVGNVTGNVTGDVYASNASKILDAGTDGTDATFTGSVTGSVSSIANHNTDDLSEGSTNQYLTSARVRSNIGVTDIDGDGSLAYNTSTGIITYTGPSASEVRAHFSGGTGITITGGTIATTITQYTDSQASSVADSRFDAKLAAADTDNLSEGVNQYHTTARVDARIQAAIKDEDNMASDSATHIPSQQSVKAYVDGATVAPVLAVAATTGSTNITVGTDTLTITGGTGIDSSITGNTATLSISSNMLQFGADTGTAFYRNFGSLLNVIGTSNEIETSVSSNQIQVGLPNDVTIGDVLTVTGGASVGGNLTVDGSVTLGNATTDTVVIAGNLTVSGTQTIINSNTVNIGDNIIVLNSDEAGTPSQNAGIEIERGTSTNRSLLWMEGGDYWQFDGSASVYASKFVGNLAGDVYASNGTSKILEAGTDGTDATFTGTSSNSSNIATTVDTTSDAVFYPIFVDGNTGSEAPMVDTGLNYNPGTGTMSATNFSGNISGSATTASGVTVTENSTEDATHYLTFVNGTSSTRAVRVDSALTFNPYDDEVTASGSFVGASFVKSGGASTSFLMADGTTTDVSSGKYAISITGDAGTLEGSNKAFYTNASNISTGTLNSNRLPSLVLTDFDSSAYLIGGATFVDSNSKLMTAAAIEDKIIGYSYSTTTGTVTNVTGSKGIVVGGGSSTTPALTLSLYNVDSLSGSVNAGGDSLVIIDDSDSDKTKKVSIATFAASLAGSGLGATGAGQLTIAGSLNVNSLSSSAVITSTENFADNDSTFMTSGAIDNHIDTRLDATLNLGNFNASTIQIGTESFADNDTTLMTSAAIKDFVQGAFNHSNHTGASVALNGDTLEITNLASTNLSLTDSGDANSTHYITMTSGATGSQTVKTDAGLTYNASTNTLTGGEFVGGGSGLTGLTSGQIPNNSANTTGSAASLTNAKNFSIAGDITAPSISFNGTGHVALQSTLATVNSNAGQHGSTTTIPIITVDAKGRITAASTANIGNTWTIEDDNGGSTVNYSVAQGEKLKLTGSNGITSIMTSAGSTRTLDIALGTSGVTANSYGSSTLIPQITVDAYGRITAVTTNSIPADTIASAGSSAGSVGNGISSYNSSHFSVTSGFVSLAGNISNAQLSNPSITIRDSESTPNTSNVNLGETLIFAGTTNEVTVLENNKTVTIGLPDDVTITGNLTVNGTTTTINTTNTVVRDSLIELSNGTTGSPANDAGIVIERGDSDNAFFGWDESADKFTLGTGTFTGASTGNLSFTTGTLVANLTGAVTGNVTGNVTGDVFATDGTKVLENGTDGTDALFTGGATKVLHEAENSDNANYYIPFFSTQTSTTGSVPKTDSDLKYNPSTGRITAGNIQGNLFGNVTGNVTGNITGNVNGSITGTVSGNAGSASVLQTPRSIYIGTGYVSFDGSANVDLTEAMEDAVGAMFASNTENGSTITYDDTDGTLDITTTALYNGTSKKLEATSTGLEVFGHILPDTTETYDLGSPTKRFRKGYFDAGTIFLGTQELTADSSGITVSGDFTANNITGTLTGNVTGNASGTANSLTTARNITVGSGVHHSFDGSADIDLTEAIQDVVGAMFSSNTETGITVTYQDSDGTIDLVASSGSSGATIDIGTSAPSSPSAGQLWWDSSDLTPYVYYNDGGSSQWVQFVSSSSSGNSVVSVSTSAPSGPTPGQLWWDSSDLTPYVYYNDGGSSQWVEFVSGGGGGSSNSLVTVGTSAPSSPSAGELWWDSSDFTPYVYYNDGTSSQWVEFSPGGQSNAYTMPSSIGTAGQVLRVPTSGTVLEWVDPPGTGVETIRQDGTISVNTGTQRWYVPANVVITKIVARVNTAPTGASMNLTLNKVSGGTTTTTTMSIADGANKAENNSPSLSLNYDDYLTVDVTQIGSTQAGQDLQLIISYTY